MEKVDFKDIQHLIPKNCPYNHKDFRAPILYAEGDQTWNDPVDLDEIYGVDETEDLYPFVLIKGNLDATNIFNEETEASTRLVVLSDLNADHIVVGGQCIYVNGPIYEFYHFQQEGEGIDEKEKIVLYTQDENDFSSGIYEVNITECEKFKNALRHFQVLDDRIHKYNETH